jgi:hypothetical protein
LPLCKLEPQLEGVIDSEFGGPHWRQPDSLGLCCTQTGTAVNGSDSDMGAGVLLAQESLSESKPDHCLVKRARLRVKSVPVRKKRVKSFFASEKVENVPNLLQGSCVMFKAHRQDLESSTSAMLAAIESVISDIEQQESVTSNDVQDCIEKLVSNDTFGFDPFPFHEIDPIIQRKSLRGLSDLTKQEWLALYEFGMR